jgi:murein DD-endopeptidase MepM/ murein hydrolase activator NlpD
MRLRALAVLLCWLAAMAARPAPALPPGQGLAVSWSTALPGNRVEAGTPVLVRVRLSASEAGREFEGSWLGHRFALAGRGAERWAIVGPDVAAQPGDSELAITAAAEAGRPAIELHAAVAVLAADYRTSTLSVPPRFVAPGPEDQALIAAAAAAKDEAWRRTAAEPLWRGRFRAPVRAEATDSFGTRRLFNGQLNSIHRGMDYRARAGTPVSASNSGRVLLAQKLFFEGNCVILDHGLGLQTIYMHLSRLDVRPGERIARGGRLGLSGATGRVTGPHLHFAVRWDGAYLDPALLLRMPLPGE